MEHTPAIAEQPRVPQKVGRAVLESALGSTRAPETGGEPLMAVPPDLLSGERSPELKAWYRSVTETPQQRVARISKSIQDARDRGVPENQIRDPKAY